MVQKNQPTKRLNLKFAERWQFARFVVPKGFARTFLSEAWFATNRKNTVLKQQKLAINPLLLHQMTKAANAAFVMQGRRARQTMHQPFDGFGAACDVKRPTDTVGLCHSEACSKKPTDFDLARQTLFLIITDYQFVSRSGVAVIWWIERSAPLNSCSSSRRMPTVFFSNP